MSGPQKNPEKRFKELAIRLAGLLSISLIGLLVIICGLSLSLGFRRISMIGFFVILALLALLRIGISILKK